MKYKLIISPEVYISVDSPQFLMYNTSNGRYIKGKDEMLSEILCKICNNSYMCVIDHATYEKIELFIQMIFENRLGDCLPMKCVKGCIQSTPIINIQKDLRRSKGLMTNEIGIDLMTNLHEINLFIELDCQQSCEECKIAFLQHLCCSKFSCRNDMNALIAFLSRSRIPPMTKLNLTICGSMKHKDFIDTYERISEIHEIYSICITDNNFSFDIASSLNCKIYVNVFSPVVNRDYCVSANVEYIFFVSNEEMLENARLVVRKYNLKGCTIKPLAIGDNNAFFQKYVYLSPQEILKTQHSFNDINRNRTLNSFLFGIINIMPDGSVYASLNMEKIGEIYNNSLYEIVKKELFQGRSWMLTRQKMAYCKRCTNTDLCPSVSECELFIGSRICNKRK